MKKNEIKLDDNSTELMLQVIKSNEEECLDNVLELICRTACDAHNREITNGIYEDYLEDKENPIVNNASDWKNGYEYGVLTACEYLSDLLTDNGFDV